MELTKILSSESDQMKDDTHHLDKAVELLRSGATMLGQACPACGTPLFKIGEQVMCAKCNKPVVILKATEDESKIFRGQTLATTEHTLLVKIDEAQSAIEKEQDPTKIAQLTQSLSNLLSALERLKKVDR
jgi:uncharacterized Zn finger protein (UPF0148 family)